MILRGDIEILALARVSADPLIVNHLKYDGEGDAF